MTASVQRAAVRRWALGDDVHGSVAERFRHEAPVPVLDVGCGDGELARRGVDGWIGLDLDPDLDTALRPTIVADAAALPVRDGSVGGVAALWCLYLLDDPAAAIAEARRVLRPGGLFAACTTARDDSPELLAHLPPQPPTSFDAEEAPSLVADVFDAVEVDRWDRPDVRLPDREAVVAYLVGRGLGEDVAEEVAARVEVPLDVTRRGAVLWARG